MISSIAFETSIGPEYKRNNRSTRQKSLRCFPACGIKGHVTGGFCGLPLKVTLDVTRESTSLEFNPDDYRFIAEIRPVSQPRISREKNIAESVLNRQIRSKYEKNEANGEIFQADTVTVLSTTGKQAELELVFNSQHCSWDYSWKSNRWSGPQEQHVVDIIALRCVSANDIRVVSSASSPPFVVSSSHKKPVKSNQNSTKEEDNEENICMLVPPSTGKGRRGRSARAEDRDGLQRSASMGSMPTGGVLTSKIITEKASNMIGSFGYPWRQQLKVSADGETLEFVRQDGAADKQTSDQESVTEGAMALIQLCTNPAPVVAAAKKDKKVLANGSGEEEAPKKRAKSGNRSAEPSMHLFSPYPYSPYQFPGYSPYPYPYPYPYPPPPGGKDGYSTGTHESSETAAAAGSGKGKSKVGKYPQQQQQQQQQHMMYPPPHYPYPPPPPPHMYPYPPPPIQHHHQHQQQPAGGTEQQGYPPMHMYPYPPPPPYNMQGGPPGSSSAGGAPSGGGGGGPPAYPGYPPGMHGHMSMSMPMPYPPMPYPGQCAAAKGPFTFHDQSAENSSTSGSDTDGEEDQASEEGSVDDGDAPITSSSTAALDLSDDDTDHHVYDSSRAAREVATQAQLPVAVPLPVSEVQLPSLDKTVSLVRRGQHHRAGGNHNHSFNYSSDRSAELIIAPYSAEPRIGYEVIQQRIADKAAARATRVAVSTSD